MTKSIIWKVVKEKITFVLQAFCLLFGSTVVITIPQYSCTSWFLYVYDPLSCFKDCSIYVGEYIISCESFSFLILHTFVYIKFCILVNIYNMYWIKRNCHLFFSLLVQMSYWYKSVLNLHILTSNKMPNQGTI